MVRSVSPLLVLVAVFFALVLGPGAPPVDAQTPMTCSAVLGNNCTYAGCWISGGGAPLTIASVSQVSEIACALCDDTAEIAHFGAPQPGRGQCVSPTAPCLSCSWCIAALSGCPGGGGGMPPLCDPAGWDHQDPEQLIALGEPTVWQLELGRHDPLLVMAYRPERSLLPRVTLPADAGLYLVTAPGGKYLVEGRDFKAFNARLLPVLRSLAKIRRGNHFRDDAPPRIHLDGDEHGRGAVTLRVGEWALEWRAVAPLEGERFPFGQYPRLLFGRRPATLEDLERAGAVLTPME